MRRPVTLTVAAALLVHLIAPSRALPLAATDERAPEPSPVTVPSGSAEASFLDSHRRLQAGGRPDKCTDDSSFQTWLAAVNMACCQKAVR